MPGGGRGAVPTPRAAAATGPGSGALEVEVESAGDGAAVVHLAGELVRFEGRRLREAVADCLAAGRRLLVVDAARVAGWDEAGAAVLAGARIGARVADGELHLAGADTGLWDQVQAADPGRPWQRWDSAKQALAVLGPRSRTPGPAEEH
jgi:anti-anti-sigma regulatory factor